MSKIKVLKKAGCTNARLKEIFTAETPTEEEKQNLTEEELDRREKDVEIRENIEFRIDSRVNDGIERSCKHSRFYQSVDLAWDSTPVQDETVPLLLYAQGKIDKTSAVEDLKNLSCAEQYCDYDEKGEIKDINLPKLYEVSVSIVRSYVTRRVMAQASRFTNLWPYFKYDSRYTRPQDKLYADAVSQRVEIMADQFGYRRLFSDQVIRDMFLYGHSVLFPIEAWTENRDWVIKDQPSVFADSDAEMVDESVGGGIEFTKPHPTRVFWDSSKPLAQINSDTGPDYIGYWDVVPFRELKSNSHYFNRDHISYSSSLASLSSAYQRFFDYYFDPTILKFPEVDNLFDTNDRKRSAGYYSADMEDQSVYLTQYFEKINPQEEGIGDYPYETWVRYVVASDNTVVGAEWLPSIPACYGGVNENDERMINASMAHELMPFQDQLTNIFSQMLLNMKNGLMQLWFVNEDVLDDDMKEYIKHTLSSDQYYVNPKAVFYSGVKLQDLGLTPESAVNIVQANIQEKVRDALVSISQVLNLVERLLIFSPQELGQAAPREISASEVVEISNTTNSIYSYISDGIDHQREAIKKLIYESMISFEDSEFELPTLYRYSKDVVSKAGFGVNDEEDDGNVRRTIKGSWEGKPHALIFSTRDGAERVNNTQAAQTLTQLVQSLGQIPGVIEGMGKEKLYEVINEIFRLSGSTDVSLEVAEEEAQPSMEQRISQLEQMLSQMSGGQQPAAKKSAQGLESLIAGAKKGSPAKLPTSGPSGAGSLPRTQNPRT